MTDRLPVSAQRRDWRDDYRALESMTEADLREAVAALPLTVRDALAQGPNPRRYACGVCDAFGKPYLAELRAKVACGEPMNPADPMWRAFAYHEVPKARMTRAEQQWYGPLADEVYERALGTYKAAGWQPSEAA